MIIPQPRKLTRQHARPQHFQNRRPGVAFFMIISCSDADSPNRRKRLHDRAGL